MRDGPTLRLIGGPTALISYGGLRLLTDPTFDPPGEYPRPGTSVVLRKVAGPALMIEEVEPIDAVLLSHDHHSDNLDRSGKAMLRAWGESSRPTPVRNGSAVTLSGCSRATWSSSTSLVAGP